MKFLKITIVLILSFLFVQPLFGQKDLLQSLIDESESHVQKVTATFKGTRIINGHSVELRGEGNLDFMISHRFGALNSGGYNLFGLDNAHIRIGLEYAIWDRLTVGIGRNSFQKAYDGFLKGKLLEQQTGEGNFPFSMTVFSGLSYETLKRPDLELNFVRRLAYVQQLLIARKVSEKLSVQLTPSFVHRNLVPSGTDKNDMAVLGIGSRFKLSKRTSLNFEYFYRIDPDPTDVNHNLIAFGVDIETGGHVFQLHLTNAQSMTETSFLTETTGDFWAGDIFFGFNISRAFQLKK